MLQQSCAHPYARCDHFRKLSILTIWFAIVVLVKQAGIKYANRSRQVVSLGQVAVGNRNNVCWISRTDDDIACLL